jgi:hypothetical protein
LRFKKRFGGCDLPDESCRKCGGLLLDYVVCAKCRASIQFICRICGVKTVEQFHDTICFRIDDSCEKNVFNFPQMVNEDKLEQKIR